MFSVAFVVFLVLGQGEKMVIVIKQVNSLQSGHTLFLSCQSLALLKSHSILPHLIFFDLVSLDFSFFNKTLLVFLPPASSESQQPSSESVDLFIRRLALISSSVGCRIGADALTEDTDT